MVFDKLATYLAYLRTKKQPTEAVCFPDFPHGLTWFNSTPLTAQDLQGKIAVIIFSTSCCINCLHALAALKKIERKYADKPVLFIGVHTPKFPNENLDASVESALLRHHIVHPVIHDPKRLLWNALQIHAWPTLLVLGPKKECLYLASGEGKIPEIDLMIQASLQHYPLRANASPAPKKDKKLPFFPTKIAVDSLRGHLYVSDCANDRILEIKETGELLRIFGAGQPGFQDGSAEIARFTQPQGLLCHGEMLFIADTGNHALRAIDLSSGKVHTLSGCSEQGFDYRGGKTGMRQHLSSPWDLALAKNLLFIAMAGTHQIWTYSLDTEIAAAFSGTGQELHLNSEEPISAAWAQPSGLSIGGSHTLFIADSESSSIRSMDLLCGSTTTLAGGDPENPSDLFLFGDLDGMARHARLQRPMGVLWIEELGQLVVADTFNHRLKLLDPQKKSIASWIGSGRRGHVDRPLAQACFDEPSGLALSKDGAKIFVADTNNHAIRSIDIKTGVATTLYTS